MNQRLRARPRRRWTRHVILAAGALIVLSAGRTLYAQSAAIEWGAYGHDPGGSRFSPATQISRDNVSGLQVAWTFRTGDMLRDDRQGVALGRFEATPLYVDGSVYVSTPIGTVFALDPERGTERWHFDAHLDLDADYGDFANRGVSTWLDRSRPLGSSCRRRIFFAPVDARLIALDAATGHPCTGFGSGGQVQLTTGLLNAPDYKGEYEVTSPPAVVGDVVVVGSAVADNHRINAPSGVVRAYDARSGALRWSWDPIPRQPGAPGYDSWQGRKAHETGAANAWSVMSVDTARGLLFVPIGSASPDYYGGERIGQDLYSNSVVAIRAATGAVVWHFQVVHHALWDYDVPAQPVLVDLRRPDAATSTPAVVVATKMGHLFVLDRETGAPLFPIEERPVPVSDVAGEQSWPTQPFPVLPAPLTPERLLPEDAWGVTPAERDACRKRMSGLRTEGIFTPPSLAGTIMFPGNIGGSNWGGIAWDPTRALIVGPTNRVAFVVQLVPRDRHVTHDMMAPTAEYGPQTGTPYGMIRDPLLSPLGVPCNPPPWGTIDAVDLATGAKRWETPLGSIPKLKDAAGYRDWGSVNLGGAMVTGGGLVFAAGGLDESLHAFDVETGRELWSAQLPAGGNAMPMTYQTPRGHQFVLIAAGGHDRLHTTAGDFILAFALPSAATPAPAAVSQPSALSTVYDGVLRIGSRQYAGEWSLTRHPNWVTGTFTADAPSSPMTGDVAGTFTGDTLHLNARWALAARSCRGTFSANATIENNGELIEGPIRLWASCGEHEEIGTMTLRQRRQAAK
jgi:quinoprotein glucose dehydrogenase